MKKQLILLFMMLVNLCAFSQNITVTGKVTESATGEPIPGASVVVKGSQIGTATSIDGSFSLPNVPGNAILTVSFLGMKPVEVPVGGKTRFEIQLSEDSQLLDEVVVVGYGSMKVKDLTSSIATVKTDEIMKTPAGQAMQSMQGKVAGLQVVSAGTPGASPTVRIRGIGSYPEKDKTNENPLYVVDGMMYDNIDFLNTADIASMSVLKDASAAAIYGVRAANGVVLIETRSGAFNQKTEITFDGYYGVQRAQNILKMANSEQFTTMAMESGSPTDIANIANAMQRYGRSRVNPNVPAPNTDWYNEVLRQAPIQNYSLDITGGGQKASYSVGANYFSQQGILDMKNEYDRFNLRSKIDFKATDWLTVGGNMIWSQATKYDEEASAWKLAYSAVPTMPVYDEMNTVAFPTEYSNAKDIGYRGVQNPFPTMDNSDKQRLNKKLLTNFYLSFDLIPKKLNFKTTYNNAYSNLEERDVLMPYDMGNGVSRLKSEIIKRMKNYSDITWDNVLSYTNSFGKHNLTVMGGTSFRDQSYTTLEVKGVDFPIGMEQSWYIDQAKEVPLTGSDGVRIIKHDGYKEYGMSYFGRVSYNYDNRYLVYGTFRADGSSKYREKWGYYPAVGAGWVISEEGFMKDIDVINYLKLRASWGKLGNNKIKADDGSLNAKVVTAIINDKEVSGTTLSGVYSQLFWELTEETNFGISSNFLNNRLDIEADYYIRDTKNAAINVTIPAVGGSVIKNVGAFRNSGFELAATWNDKIGDNWRYTISGNIATLKNEVQDLYGQPYVDGGTAEFRQRSIVGQPLLAFYGWEIDGVYQNQDQINADPGAIANELVPGDFKYKDLNGDKIIDDKDRTVLGSYFPNFTYGGSLGISYKCIDLSASFYGQSGNKILNRKRGEYLWTTDTNLDADLAINRWHGEGTSDKYPSSAGLRKGWNQKMSNYFVEDGSYFRIQNIQLAYNIKNQRWFGLEMPTMRVSFTADRPLTLFSYNGFSPEIPDGIDEQAYPIPAVYTVGLNIKF